MFFLAHRIEKPGNMVNNLLSCMKADDVPVDDTILMFALRAMSKEGPNEMSDCFEIYKQIVDCDLRVYLVLITGLIRIGDVEKAMDYYAEMLELGIEPDRGFFSSLIVDFLSMNRLDLAMRYFEYMVGRKFIPGKRLVNNLISAFSGAHDFDTVDFLLQYEEEHDIGLWLNTYKNLILHTLQDNAENPDIDRVRRYFTLMEVSIGTNTDDSAISELLDEMLRVTQVEELVEFIAEMKKTYSVRPSESAYNALITCSLNNGNIQAAIQNVSEMIEFHITPSIALFNKVIVHLSKNGMMKSVETVMNLMKKSSTPIDGETLTYVIQGYLSKGDMVQVVEMYRILCQTDESVALDMAYFLRKFGVPV
eukprot:TRINITY_DN2319_c0_g2_i1.p1 TRINITY_DN2319_c0_g2~~TRINITY_DN2319_c0_g2_i1.p1  ORF type:complete len:364 (-),score=69.26 TRINITY_DN2319_c0_g2_i1:59-1150(-)